MAALDEFERLKALIFFCAKFQLYTRSGRMNHLTSDGGAP